MASLVLRTLISGSSNDSNNSSNDHLDPYRAVTVSDKNGTWDPTYTYPADAITSCHLFLPERFAPSLPIPFSRIKEIFNGYDTTCAFFASTEEGPTER